MAHAQHPQRGKIYLHPTTCTRPSIVDAFQRRTGLRLIISTSGIVRAVPAGGAA